MCSTNNVRRFKIDLVQLRVASVSSWSCFAVFELLSIRGCSHLLSPFSLVFRFALSGTFASQRHRGAAKSDLFLDLDRGERNLASTNSVILIAFQDCLSGWMLLMARNSEANIGWVTYESAQSAELPAKLWVILVSNITLLIAYVGLPCHRLPYLSFPSIMAARFPSFELCGSVSLRLLLNSRASCHSMIASE